MRNTTITLDREEAALLEQLAAIQAKREHIAQVKAEKKQARIDAGVVAVITAAGKMLTRVPEEGDIAFELVGTSAEGYNVFSVPSNAPAKVTGFLSYPFRLALKNAGYKFNKTDKSWNK